MPNKLRQSPKEDLTGVISGRLTVLGFSHFKVYEKFKNRVPYWKCICTCGSETVVTHGHIKTKKTKSCGCLLDEWRKGAWPDRLSERNKKEFGLAAFNNVYGGYYQRAKKKAIAFELTKEEFKSFTQKECHYCGQAPTHVFKTKYTNGDFIGNGIDRIDSSKGYTIDNCVPSCQICNKAKRDISYQDFISYLDQLVKFRTK